jgi:putative holliday junction resolvase
VTQTTTNSRRILAVDYGRRRIGLALSDELGLIAQPLATMLRVNRRADLRRLSEICRRYSVARIIVGHPLRLRGEAGEMADETARFAAKLRKEIGIETELVDERLTSWEAERIVAETQPSRRRERKPLDHFAAAVLLRDYLEHKTRRPSPARPEKN